MRSPRFLTNCCVLSLGLLLAAGNLWFAAARSTISLRLDARVIGKEIRREKHPGKDDVYVLLLSPAHAVQVDESLFNSIEEGNHLQKDAWSRRLKCSGRTIALGLSADFRGMSLAMPALMVVLLAAALAQKMAGSGTEEKRKPTSSQNHQLA